jgi:acetyl esterase/lipase
MNRLPAFLLLLVLVLPLTSVHGDDDGEKKPPDRPRRPRPTFEQFAARHDANDDGRITREEFKGRKRLFDRLDRDGDGVVTKREFDDLVSRRGNRRSRALPEGVKAVPDVEYAKVAGQSLHVDLYLPVREPPAEGSKPAPKPPLIVWVHGGGWTKGTRKNLHPTFRKLTGEGYAAASVEYRLTGLDSHPDQIHDVKGAIRWLRAHADEYGYDASKIGVGGGSAGGHLVLLLGTSGGVKELEGTVGGNAETSSRVQAVVDFYGPTNLANLGRRRLGEEAEEESIARRKSASPLTYVTKDDPPVLAFHGDKDRLVPPEHGKALVSKYEAAGLTATLHVIEGAGHGGPEFSDEARYVLVKTFFDEQLRGIAPPAERPKPPDLEPEEEN